MRETVCCLPLSPTCETYSHSWIVKNVKCLLFSSSFTFDLFCFALLTATAENEREIQNKNKNEKSSYTWVDRKFFYFLMLFRFAMALFKRIMMCDFPIHSNHFFSSSLCWSKQKKFSLHSFLLLHFVVEAKKKNFIVRHEKPVRNG